MKLVVMTTFSAMISLSALAQVSPLQDYMASIVPKNVVIDTFSKMRVETKRRSQCFNRAYVWSHEMLRNEDIHSKKILIYYTNKYRKDLDPKWGFHIAPMVTMQNTIDKDARAPFASEDSLEVHAPMMGKYFGSKADADRELNDYKSLTKTNLQVVMDREFSNDPMPLHHWTRRFIENGERKLEFKRREIVSELKDLQQKLAATPSRQAEKAKSLREKIAEKNRELVKLKVSENKPAEIKCKMIEQIDVFDEENTRGEDAKEWCLLQVVSMHYWNPVDLRELVYENVQSTQQLSDRLWTARKQAFENWDEIWPTQKDVQDKIDKKIKEIDDKFDKEMKAVTKSFDDQLKTLNDDLKKAQKQKPVNPVLVSSLKSQIEKIEMNKAVRLEKIESDRNKEMTAVFEWQKTQLSISDL